jgi:hypothetical protein
MRALTLEAEESCVRKVWEVMEVLHHREGPR